MPARFARTRLAIAALSLFSLSACAVEAPTGPSVPVMPGDNKTLSQFEQDDNACREFAASRTGVTPGAAANQAGVGSAVVGTLVGAAVGALIGTAAGDPAIGAAIGGGAGLLTGTAAGLNNAAISGGDIQYRYDIAYQQCMATTGNKVAQTPAPAYSAPAYAAPGPAYVAPAPVYVYPAPYYYYPYPPAYYYPCCYGPSIGIGATFFFGDHGDDHHHHHH